MLFSYAPWCPACKNLAPTWEEFATWSSDLGVRAGKVDVTTSPALSGRFFVTALPTIFHVMNGEFRQYRGSRDIQSLQNFIEERKWEKLETVSSWTKPDSIQMSIVSYFFKLSHVLKEFNNQLLKEYGLPPWAAYVIFAVATILLGAILGLVLVCIIDFIFPPKVSARQSFIEVQEKDDQLPPGEDIEGDDLEDEDENAEETSDGEKFSQSDSDAPEDVKKSPPGTPGKSGATSSPDVRKRRTRKAD